MLLSPKLGRVQTEKEKMAGAESEPAHLVYNREKNLKRGINKGRLGK